MYTIMKSIIKITTISVLAVLACVGCTDAFEEVNWPYGGVTEEELDRDNVRQGSMIPAMELLIVPMDDNAHFQHCESLVGDVAGRMLMSNAGGAPGQKWTGDFSRFSYDHTGWYDNPFNYTMGFYTSYINSLKFVQTGATEDGSGNTVFEYDKSNAIYAIIRILRVAVMHRLADMYGPIPFSQIKPEDLNLYIPYDDDNTVYINEDVAHQGLLPMLSEAIADLKNCLLTNREGMMNIANFDRIYEGDYIQWVKYANSLMLRLAMRISNREPALARRYAEEAIKPFEVQSGNQTETIACGVIDNNTDNAVMHMQIGHMSKITSKLYSIAYGYIDTFAAADMVCYLQGYNDPRIEKYFNTVEIENADGSKTSIYNGLRAGTTIGQSDIQTKFSKPKVDVYDDYPLLTAAEVAFLRAEGMLKGWEMGGSAESFYNEGVRLSFEQWGASGYATYIEGETAPVKYEDVVTNNREDADAPSDITVKWANDGKELQRIITQKYLALYPLGHEAWCDYRRTGYPDILPVYQNTISTTLKVISRLPLPHTEETQNADNFLEAQSMLSGPDDMKTKIWWAKQD